MLVSLNITLSLMDSTNSPFKKKIPQKLQNFDKTKNLLRLTNTKFSPFVPLLFVFLFSFVLLSAGSFSLPLIDRDEPRFAQAAREMMERKNFVVPFFNGEFRLDKPPLIYWLMVLSYKLLGIDEFSARLPSILSCSILAVILYCIAYRYSPSVRLIVPISFCFSLQTLLHGRLATADMAMILFVTTAQWAFLNLLNQKSWFWFSIFWISLALGFLAKGPISWLIPLFTFILFRFVFWRKQKAIPSLHLIPGLLLCLSIISLWALPALIETKGLFWKIGIGEHVIRRGMEAFDNRPFIPFYYFISPFLSLFPSSAFFGLFIETLRKKWSMENAFFLSWFLAPIIIFSFYATELPHYIMPGFPAYFLVTGQGINEAKKTKFSLLFALLLLVVFFLFSLFLVSLYPFYGIILNHPLKNVLLSIGLVILLLCLFGGAMMLYGHNLSSRTAPFLMMATSYIALICILNFLAKDLRCLSLTVKIAPLFKNMPLASQNCAWGYTEPSLVFYSNRLWTWDPPLAPVLPPYFSLRLETETSLFKTLPWPLDEKNHPRSTYKNDSALGTPLPVQASQGEGRIEGLNLGRMSWVKIDFSYHY